MTNEQLRALLPENWPEAMKAKLEAKMRFAAEKAAELPYIPYTTANGNWTPTSIDWWTNGFWGAEMWQMFLMSGDRYFRDAAVRAEEMMDASLQNFKQLHHDVGFMWLIQSGVRYALEKNQDSFDRTLFCANMLAGRFNPNGFIRAWNGSDNQGWAIIDCMMNIPLLYWASRQTGDPRFKLIAMKHADTAMEHFVREDGSCNHIVSFDPETGAYLDNPAGQGYASGSSWSRGQAWAIYGFTLSYQQTGKQSYLDTAVRVANYFIDNVPHTGWIPACDFRSPLADTLMDNAAGAIAACGLLALADCLPQDQQLPYASAACKLLVAMEESCCDWTQSQPAILTKCTRAYHNHERHITMNYADYYFIEAVNKLLGSNYSFWAPDLLPEM